MIAGAERLSPAKIGDARPILGEQNVDTDGHLHGDEEVVTIKRVAQHDISAGKGSLQLTQQS